MLQIHMFLLPEEAATVTLSLSSTWDVSFLENACSKGGGQVSVRQCDSGSKCLLVTATTGQKRNAIHYQRPRAWFVAFSDDPKLLPEEICADFFPQLRVVNSTKTIKHLLNVPMRTRYFGLTAQMDQSWYGDTPGDHR